LSDDVLKIDFGDGVSALDRTLRSITMIADGAIGRLLGWTRKTVNLEIPADDPLPCYVTVRRKRVFEIKPVKYDDGSIVIQGEWIAGSPRKPTMIDRFWGC
jgi:hypothetical protein